MISPDEVLTEDIISFESQLYDTMILQNQIELNNSSDMKQWNDDDDINVSQIGLHLDNKLFKFPDSSDGTVWKRYGNWKLSLRTSREETVDCIGKHKIWELLITHTYCALIKLNPDSKYDRRMTLHYGVVLPLFRANSATRNLIKSYGEYIMMKHVHGFVKSQFDRQTKIFSRRESKPEWYEILIPELSIKETADEMERRRKKYTKLFTEYKERIKSKYGD